MSDLAELHPNYTFAAQQWQRTRDAAAGQAVVKSNRTTYLAPTNAMTADGALRGAEPGYSAYEGYLSRAVFPDLTGEALRTFVGLLSGDPVIELPAALEPMRNAATNTGLGLVDLLRQIHEQQLVAGRYELLLDVAPQSATPIIVPYFAESLTNWDVQRNLSTGIESLEVAVLTEAGSERIPGSMAWETYKRYRFLGLDENGTYLTYTQDDDGAETPIVAPSFRGKTLDFIPLTVIGARDLDVRPGDIPLAGLADASYTIYQGQADLRQSLHASAQETLVVTGLEPGNDDEEVRLGAGACVRLPEGADAKYIGISGRGMEEQRLVLAEDYDRAVARGAALLERTSSQAESGSALSLRIQAKTVTLTDVARTAAAGLENSLRQAAIWVGANPEDVRVEADLSFSEDTLANAAAIAQLQQAVEGGFPLDGDDLTRIAEREDLKQS